MKLPNSFGSVYKLSGNRRNPWVARKTTGFTFNEKTKKSSPVYVFLGYYPTRKEALTALTEYNKDPYDLHLTSITFAEVFDKWSAEYFPKISDSNCKGYNASYRICSKIQDMPFVQLKLDHLQMVVNESGKNSPTLKKLKSLFNEMYDYAVIHEIVSPDKREMVKYVDISQAGNPNALNRAPFSDKEIEALWKLKDGNPYYNVMLMLIYTGVRISELLELKKKDVHLEERWFKVQESKTEAGIREVPIAEKIVPFFEYWLSRPCDYLICSPENEPFKYRNYYDSYWIALLVSAGMGKLVNEPGKKKPVFYGHRPHDTRHTCVSLLTVAGVDERIIRKIVGHKGQGVTENVYTHLELPVKLEAINKI